MKPYDNDFYIGTIDKGTTKVSYTQIKDGNRYKKVFSVEQDGKIIYLTKSEAEGWIKRLPILIERWKIED